MATQQTVKTQPNTHANLTDLHTETTSIPDDDQVSITALDIIKWEHWIQ